MYRVYDRKGPIFGLGNFVCDFICDTLDDIGTLPTSSAEGTGGVTEYDNQKCASGSVAYISGEAENKLYMLNNQDVWDPQ